MEQGILLIGYYELESRIDVPFRAVINEAVNMAKRFGAEDARAVAAPKPLEAPSIKAQSANVVVFIVKMFLLWLVCFTSDGKLMIL